jgi:plasmid stabilization system protein ParE
MLLRWMPSASNDLQRIADYLREHAPEVEAKIVLEIFAGIESLQHFPFKGRPTRRIGIRQELESDNWSSCESGMWLPLV